jgi:cell division protein FtsA
MGVGGLIDVIHDPSYATGVGLILYAHRTQQAQRRRGRATRQPGSSKPGFWARLKNWLREVV